MIKLRQTGLSIEDPYQSRPILRRVKRVTLLASAIGLLSTSLFGIGAGWTYYHLTRNPHKDTSSSEIYKERMKTRLSNTMYATIGSALISFLCWQGGKKLDDYVEEHQSHSQD